MSEAEVARRIWYFQVAAFRALGPGPWFETADGELTQDMDEADQFWGTYEEARKLHPECAPVTL